ncbi:MAG: RNA polymerase sigma factor, partial [Eubacteriales bacterium]|nr:RNA polymerase sigma factor [Eubacteriales bacterium]
MKTDEIIKLLSEKAFLDKLFGYSYKRCNTSHDAEDLCSSIVLAVMKAARKSTEIDNPQTYVWTIAHRVYADFCKKRKAYADNVISTEYSDDIQNTSVSPIDEYIELQDEKEQLSKILTEISFLAKIYRDVMVMYYLDGLKTAEISKALGISESAVKQRLFSARNTIKKEVNKMNVNTLSLKPVHLQFVGTGNPVGNDPCELAQRSLSQNIIYLCKNEAKSAKEISESLGIPMPYVEEEIEIQCKGKNGSYGLLRDLQNGKFISNILIAEATEYDKANEIYEKHLDDFCEVLQNVIEKNCGKILSFPFLSKQDDPKFILWSLISNTVWGLQEKVNKYLESECFPKIQSIKREFTSVATAVHEGEDLTQGFIGCDGVTANNLCGFSRVFFSNIYSDRIEKHFGCGHNLSIDPQIMMTLRVIGGLSIDSLSDEEKEIATKAIECGYLRKSGNMIEPKILIFEEENQSAFYNLLSGLD